MKRRTWLLTGAGALGALVVGWGAMPPRSRLGDAHTLPAVDGQVALNGWIKITSDGTVLLAMNRSEMGQGVHTALSQLVAEELDVPLHSVRLAEAGFDAIYGNIATFLGNVPFGPRDHGRAVFKFSNWITAKVGRELGLNLTGGSSSTADAWDTLRLAAATARAQLLGAAALKHKLPVDELTVKAGTIHHASGALSHYGELAAQAALTPPGEVRIKDRKQWTQIGRALPRNDLAAKLNGSARFGLDVRQHGQVFAAIRHCPMLGGGLGPANVDAIRARPGVLRVVALGPVAGSTAAYAVVARTTWHAREAARALDVAWQDPPNGRLDSRAILASLEAEARRAHAAGEGFAFLKQGDVPAALAGAATRLEAVYSAPHLAHTTMEPMNCTAQVLDGHVTVWAPTQVPGFARDVAARVAGVPPENVTVHVTYLGGGFGRRLDVDFVGQAVRIALEMAGLPVQLVWSREEDMAHDFYRPAEVAVMQGGLDGAGQPVALAVTNAADAIVPRWSERVMPGLAPTLDILNRNNFPDGRAPAALFRRGDAPDKTASEGLFELAYAIPNARIAHQATHSGVPVGMWRGVGHSHHAFFMEGFIDELAHAAKADPVAFRMKLLEGLPRHQAVLKRAAEAAGWGQPLPAGVARGVAVHESFGSVVAQVIEVARQDGKPRARRVVCAIDCGTVVNPGIVVRQMESCIVFGLTAALWGRIDIVGGEVQQKNFPDHPLLTLAQCPVIETHLVPSEGPPTGVGEPGLPPVAPALANAWFSLTGERRRRLPLAA
ncbi:isoquinoline 1-oxidoreductase beta subunit [Pelomonas saccharophila]|uniref:Isoquinoline 1-oxidoreductase beta subunit n=1 Tax=Roseateles saccharophilus TaxID=304 RepID=A0ABU1YLV0_ROSSA|nr:molybdopterin cofactor-binding domain-containing protein [Roseateles saccharophilus]MDR7269815.1 isoquinoline 1-oxidoreductase beta subunit [Roseateles saccharophilus]